MTDDEWTIIMIFNDNDVQLIIINAKMKFITFSWNKQYKCVSEALKLADSFFAWRVVNIVFQSL